MASTNDGAVDVGGFVVSAEQVPAVASWARDFASDCEWNESHAGHEDCQPWRTLDDASVIRAAARHYDGGIRAMAADALADEELQARADDDARARGFTGSVATPGARRERVQAAKDAHVQNEVAISTLPISGHGAAQHDARWSVRAFFSDGSAVLYPRGEYKRLARETAREVLASALAPARHPRKPARELVATVVVDGYEELAPIRRDVFTTPSCNVFAAAESVGVFLRAMARREPAKPAQHEGYCAACMQDVHCGACSCCAGDPDAAEEETPGYVVRRLHSGTEDGYLWYVVRSADDARVSGGWLYEEHAAEECQTLLDGRARVVAWAYCDTCSQCADVSEDEASSFECSTHGPMARGFDVVAVEGAKDDEARLVVVDTESHRVGWIIGDFVATDEDVVRYSYAENECQGSAPADSVKVTREDFARSSGLAPLVTRAQLETIDKLAEASEVLARVPVSVDVVPDVTAEGFERGAVLVLLTPDDDGAPEPVRSVWSATGASRIPVPEVGGENAYARALAFIRADGSRPITERTSTSTFRVLPGGSYSRRQF